MSASHIETTQSSDIRPNKSLYLHCEIITISIANFFPSHQYCTGAVLASVFLCNIGCTQNGHILRNNFLK